MRKLEGREVALDVVMLGITRLQGERWWAVDVCGSGNQQRKGFARWNRKGKERDEPIRVSGHPISVGLFISGFEKSIAMAFWILRRKHIHKNVRLGEVACVVFCSAATDQFINLLYGDGKAWTLFIPRMHVGWGYRLADLHLVVICGYTL